jgi:hypothetical protein
MAAEDPTDALQAGIYAILSGDATLTALANVYDGVPEGDDPAWVIIGETLSAPDGVHGLEGRQTSFTIHTWARAHGFAPVNTIGARVVALLWHRHTELSAEVAGHRVWRVDHEYSQTLRDPEPDLRHRVDRFRIWSHQEAP